MKVYEVKSNGVTIEWTTSLQSDEEAFKQSATRNKQLFVVDVELATKKQLY